MPTGYTVKLHDGTDQTFPDFVLNCARAFGALIELRDEPDAPIPDEFKPSDYYDRALERDRAELAEVRAMSEDEVEIAAEAEYQRALTSHRDSERKRDAVRKRYEAMLAQVRAWVPPTPEHEELKTFMDNQITESIDFDCHSWPAPERKSGEQWRADHIARSERSIELDTKHRDGEIERAKGRTAWVRALRESLGGSS